MGLKPLSSLVGKKIVMALTGLALYGFLVGHLAGNTLLLRRDGGHAFNAYSAFLSGHPLLVPVEILLLAVFLLHLYVAVGVSLANRRARPVGYHTRIRSVGGRTWASSTMLYSGLLILIFVFLHVRMFKYGDRGSGTLYDLVTATFRSTGYRTAYVLAMAVLGFHLYHAFQSAFQTLSIHSPTLRRLCLLVSLALALGFGLIPVYVGLLM